MNRDKTGEQLHSVGVDGRVNAISIKKGIECTELMRLKRASRGGEFGDAMISRESGGMCLDFDSQDSKVYIVGTEDGVIYKCSTSFSEQFLETYTGHNGPIYRVRYNPLRPQMFLSCSADWTVRIWENAKSSVTIESFTESKATQSSCVSDIAWSPYVWSMFASVSITGKLELWDIAYSTYVDTFSTNFV